LVREDKTMRRKSFVMLLILVMVTGTNLFVKAAPTATIKWLEWWDPEYGTKIMDELVSRFEAQSGIHVDRTSVPWGNMYDNLVTNAQAKTATYDVLGMEACCFLTGIDKLGGIEPLGPYLEKDADFAKGLTDLTVVNWLGKPMMLNWYIFPYSYVYNMDVFEKAGVKPPTTWDDVIKVSKAVQDSGAAKYGLGVGFGSQDLIQVTYYMFGSRLAQLGGRFFDKDGKAVFNSPEGVAALKWWKSLYDSGVLAPGALGMSFAQAREFLAAGTIAATWEGPFAGTIAKQVNPKIRIAYPTAWRDKTGGYQWAGSGLAISSNSEHKEEAWKFLKFLLSDETTLWMTQQVSIPFGSKAAVAALSNSDDPILKQIPAMLTQDPEHNLVLLPTPEFEKLHGAFVEAFQAVMAGDRDPQKALDDVVAIWNTEIDKYR
jgi:multiple sugar transport system substrate-binding protein